MNYTHIVPHAGYIAFQYITKIKILPFFSSSINPGGCLPGYAEGRLSLSGKQIYIWIAWSTRHLFPHNKLNFNIISKIILIFIVYAGTIVNCKSLQIYGGK